MKKILFLFSFLFALHLYAQQDLKWLKIKKYKVATLSDSLKETSGLTFFREKLYTINDGGNSSEIFEIDKKSGKILNKIKIPVVNKDWEAITTDEEDLYVADFGNNYGNRKDLKIYRISLDSLNVNPKITSEINFFYQGQDNFTSKPHRHNFDAEALVYNGYNLSIFTKEWVSSNVTKYFASSSLNEDETQEVQKINQYKIGYLVTDASYYLGKLYLIGYSKKMEVYLTVFPNNGDFSQKPQKYYLGSTSSLGQVEGIAVNADGIFISAEAFNLKIFQAKQALYFIPWKDFGK